MIFRPLFGPVVPDALEGRYVPITPASEDAFSKQARPNALQTSASCSLRCKHL